MKRRFRIQIICLCVAAAVLTGSLFAAALTGSAYETLRDGLIDVAFLENATVDTKMTVYVNDELVIKSESRIEAGNGASYQRDFHEGPGYGDPATREYYVDGKYSANGMPGGEYWVYPSYGWVERGVFGYTEKDRKNLGNELNFLMLLVDTLVGDLKNNIVISPEGEGRVITGKLTAAQIPELVNAALGVLADQTWRFGIFMNNHSSMLLSDQGDHTIYTRTYINTDNMTKTIAKYKGMSMFSSRWEPEELVSEEILPLLRSDFDKVYECPLKQARMTLIEGRAEVDSQGRLTSLSGKARIECVTVFGENVTLDAEIEMLITHIGTTVPRTPGINFDDYFKYDEYGNPLGNLCYETNEDGTLREGSIFFRRYEDEYYHEDSDVILKPQDRPAEIPIPSGDPDTTGED